MLELSSLGDKEHAALFRAAEDRETDARGKFDIFAPEKGGFPSKAAVDSRWVLTRKMVDRWKMVTARSIAKGFGKPDLKDGMVRVCDLLACG